MHNLLVTSFGKPYLGDLFGDLVTVSQSHDTQLLQRLHIPLVGLLLSPGDLKSPGQSRCQYPIRRQNQRWLISPRPASDSPEGYHAPQVKKEPRERASKLHHWFKSYGHFTNELDFAYRWSCIGKGPRLQPTQQACFYNSYPVPLNET